MTARGPVSLLLLAAAAGGAIPVSAGGAEPMHGQTHVIGVLAYRPKAQVAAQWAALADILTRRIPGCRFEVELLDYQELEEAIERHRLDVVITNPGHYIVIRSRTAMSGVLATLVDRGPHGPLEAMGGVIFRRSDRGDLRTLPDLSRARIAMVGRSSLGGYQAQAGEFLRAGLEPPRGAQSLFLGMPHDRVVEAVRAGEADAGFVRAGVLEEMERDGALKAGELTVMNRHDLPGYPFATSTRLYPGWPVVALPHADDRHARAIASVLLGLTEEEIGANGAAFGGFTIPADYGSVERLLRDLRAPPFDGLPQFNAGEVLRRYALPIAALGLGGITILVLAAFLVAANRRQASTLAALREAMASVRTLRGLLPICMYCHKIRADTGYWDRLESYISTHTEALFSHGICPSCLEKNHPEQS